MRDLALNQTPKDFDIATNAKPEQVKKLFHNCRIIGRRFRLAHVYFRKEIMEVATFRGPHNSKKNSETAQTQDGLILRDNVFGSIEEDAYRRDFTINALYYNPTDNTVLDYVGGIKDLKKRHINIIGNATVRYKEDPVRMLRALRFMSKLDFTLTRETGEAIRTLNQYISLTAPARLFDEILKALHNGYAIKNYYALKDYHIFPRLFPILNALPADTQNRFDQLIDATLKSTDKRIKDRKPVTPAFFYAAVLWYPIVAQAEKLEERYKPFVALEMAIEKLLSKQIKTISIPRKFTNSMRDIWRMQYFLTHRSPSRVNRLFGHTKFRAAYDLLLLREKAGEDLQEHCQWWTDFQLHTQEQQNEMISKLAPSKRQRRRKRKKPSEKPTE